MEGGVRIRRWAVASRSSAFVRGVPVVAVAAVLTTFPASPASATTPPTVTIGTVSGTFYLNPTNSGAFDSSQLSNPVFTQTFPVIDFNPPASAQVSCSNSTGVDENTRPFRDVIPNSGGTCSTVVAQGNGQQAGVGDLPAGMVAFQAVFLANLTVDQAAQVTFNFFSDDGWVLGLGQQQGGSAQPTYISGELANPPASSPVKEYPVVGALNGPSAPTQAQVTVNFPAAGTYPMELDYTECCGGQLALTLGTTAGNPIPSGSSKIVLGFGDSVAAGYGLGRADGTGNDNTSAYPPLLASDLGIGYANYATAGACASQSDGAGGGTAQLSTCGSFSSVSDQIQTACSDLGCGDLSSPAIIPKLITLTIGANDVIFDQCIEAALLGNANDPSADPCTTSNLNANVSSFQSSLTADLQKLNTDYPRVPIYLTEYYNPLPAGPQNGQSPCTFEDIVPTLVLAAKQSGWVATGLAFFLHQDQFVSAEGDIQRALYQRAQFILSAIDQAVQVAAGQASNVTIVPLNFAGHDMCESGSTPWVFGPEFHFALELDLGPVASHTFSLDVGPIPYRAPLVQSALETTESCYFPFGPFVKRGAGTLCNSPASGRQLGVLSYSFSTNALPHPTTNGQAAIANALATAAGG